MKPINYSRMMDHRGVRLRLFDNRPDGIIHGWSLYIVWLELRVYCYGAPPTTVYVSFLNHRSIAAGGPWWRRWIVARGEFRTNEQN